MALTYVGGLAFTAGFPLPYAVGSAAGVDAAAKLAAAANFTPSASITTTAGKLEVAEQIVAGLKAALALGIEPPGLSLQFSLMADLVASLQADLNLYLSLLNLGGLTAQFYAYHGAANAAGGALTTAWAGGIPGGSGGAETIDAAIVATNAGTVATALGQIIKMVP